MEKDDTRTKQITTFISNTGYTNPISCQAPSLIKEQVASIFDENELLSIVERYGYPAFYMFSFVPSEQQDCFFLVKPSPNSYNKFAIVCSRTLKNLYFRWMFMFDYHHQLTENLLKPNYTCASFDEALVKLSISGVDLPKKLSILYSRNT